jgi:hypothetical protein
MGMHARSSGADRGDQNYQGGDRIPQQIGLLMIATAVPASAPAWIDGAQAAVALDLAPTRNNCRMDLGQVVS